MKIVLSSKPATGYGGEALTIGLFESETAESPGTRDLDKITGGLITEALSGDHFTGKEGQIVLLHKPEGLGIRRLVIAGMGRRADAGVETARRLGGMAARRLSHHGIEKAGVSLPEELANAAGVKACIEGFIMGGGGIDAYKTEKDGKSRDPYRGDYTQLTVQLPVPVSAPLKKAAKRAEVVADAMILTRRMVNAPANRMTPAIMASEARRACTAAGVSTTVWNEKQLKEKGFGGVLSVSQGSANPPRFVIMRYKPENKGAASRPPLVLVGKGITFDSGGISIKPSEGLEDMKADMAGAAAVIGAMSAIGRLKPPRPVIGITPLCENMPSGSASRPGDIIDSYSGKTIEIVNTDAEGRMILADGLAYAVEQKPGAIIDIATLTGACVVALGRVYAGLTTNNDEWSKQVIESAAGSGEKVWPMPMDTDYEPLIESEIADMRNTGKDQPGVITAAKMLEKFVGEIPWVHLDIAGVEWLKEAKPWMSAGPTAFGVRLFVDLASG